MNSPPFDCFLAELQITHNNIDFLRIVQTLCVVARASRQCERQGFTEYIFRSDNTRSKDRLTIWTSDEKGKSIHHSNRIVVWRSFTLPKGRQEVVDGKQKWSRPQKAPLLHTGTFFHAQSCLGNRFLLKCAFENDSLAAPHFTETTSRSRLSSGGQTPPSSFSVLH